MEIVVYDTNVIIDLHSVGLLSVINHSGWNIHTTQLVISELQRPSRDEVLQTFPALKVHQYDTPEAYANILSYLGGIAHRGNLSMTDASVLMLSKELNAILSTNDGKLRKVATEQGVRISGTLGIILMLLEQRLITVELAKEAINQLKTNPRISMDLCEKATNRVEYIKLIQGGQNDDIEF